MPVSKGSQLTYEDRKSIEDGIYKQKSLGEIARAINVSRSTIAREIKRNRVEDSDRFLVQGHRNVCLKKEDCQIRSLCGTSCLAPCYKCADQTCNTLCPEFEELACKKLHEPPFVCNSCMERYGRGCNHRYYFYDATKAHELAKMRLVETREGINCTEKELIKMVRTVRPLMKKGQSLEHIWATHGHEFPVGVRTFYMYINDGYLGIINMDLPKKVVYKVRKPSPKELKPKANFFGRTYEDFKELPEELQLSAVEIDCVEGKRGEYPTIFTLYFRRYCFQIMILLPQKTQADVCRAIDWLEGICYGEFSDHFTVLLADRGSEFLDFEGIEESKLFEDENRCSVYYCDPLQSGQKGGCEKNHVEIRKVLPKGTSFNDLSQWDTALISSHVNSYTRPSLGGASPYKLASQVLPQGLLDNLGIEYVAPDDINLTPGLLDYKNK